MGSFAKRVMASLALLAILVPSLASAAWMTPYGLVSNVCVSNDGTYMVFQNQSGLVNTGCSYVFYGSPVVHYGTWQ